MPIRTNVVTVPNGTVPVETRPTKHTDMYRMFDLEVSTFQKEFRIDENTFARCHIVIYANVCEYELRYDLEDHTMIRN